MDFFLKAHDYHNNRDSFQINKTEILKNSNMAAKTQVIAILFAAFLIMLCLSVKAKNNSSITIKISVAPQTNRI